MILVLVLATALQAGEADAYLRSGQKKLEVRSFDAAIPEFESCLKLDPEQFNAHFGLGSCWWAKEDYARARVHFLKVVELVEKKSPDALLTGVHQKLLGCHLLMEDFEGAIREATRLIGQQPTAEYYYDRALARQRKGDLDGALEDAAAALKESPGLTKVRTLRASLLLAKENKDAALKELDEAIRLKPGDYAGFLARGLTHYQLGNWMEAEKDLKWAAIINNAILENLEEKGYTTSLHWLVKIRLGNSGELPSDLIYYRKLLKERGKDPARNHWLSLPLYVAGSISEGDLLKMVEGAAFRKAQSLCEGHFFIGERRLLEGDKAGAKASFQKGVATEARGLLEYDLAVRRLRELGP